MVCFQYSICNNAIYVAVGELIVLIIGALVFKSLEKNDRLMNLLDLK